MSSTTAMMSQMRTRCSSRHSSTNVATTNVVSLGMPSPTGSSSETSDYQRSTPSPRDDPTALLNSLDEWPSTENHRSADSDPGFSEDLKQDPFLLPPDKKGMDHIEGDPRLMLQQVRVALEKIPATKLCCRRRKSAADLADAPVDQKKIKLEEEIGFNAGKITSYLAETKSFTALRKEKLDSILNLKSEYAVEVDRHANDLFLLSKLKQLNSGMSPLSPLKVEHGDESKRNNQSDLKQEEFFLPATPPGAPSSDNSCFEPPKSTTTTIRFPKAPSSSESSLDCRWQGCKETALESNGKLLDHLKMLHAASQNPDREEDFHYKCLWTGCKVFGKTSSSKSWLEKHVGSHAGGKIFQCIVDGCKLRFGTRSLLERHVNNHFKPTNTASDSQNGGGEANDTQTTPMPAPSSAALKVMRKAGKRLKYRQTIYSARIFDLFDLGVMAKVQERLARLHSSGSGYGNEATFTSEAVGRRQVKSGQTMVLLRWKPYNVLEDEWVPLKAAQATKKVKLSSLPHSARLELDAKIFLDRKQPQAAEPEAETTTTPTRSRRKLRVPEQNTDSLS